MGAADILGKVAAGAGAAAVGSLAIPGAGEIAAPVAGATAAVAKAGQWALMLAPLIMDFFSGNGEDADAAKKIGDARDGLAARLSSAERIPLAQATDIVNQQLAPLIQQHAQDAGSKAGHLVSDAAGIAGGVMLGRSMGKGLGKAAGAVAAAERAAPGVEAAVEEAAPALSATQSKALDSVRDVGRLDASVMASKRQGLPVISGKQERALGGIVDDNRLARRFDPLDEVPSASQRSAAGDLGLRGSFENEDMIPSLDQRAAVEDVGGEERWKNMLASEAPGMSDFEEQYKRELMRRKLAEASGYAGY